MASENSDHRIAIVGAGPAGASLAIRLARRGQGVTLIERDKFPRHKLCGEFASPETLAHFGELGVLDAMRAIGGDRIARTTFFASSGRSVSVESDWFGAGSAALSISRARMDSVMLDRARECGVDVREEAQAIGIESSGGAIRAVRIRNADGTRETVEADMFIDATGRARQLSRFAQRLRSEIGPAVAPRILGFKTHLSGAALERGNCEIYFFEGGYGGLSFVEDGAANHCFLVSADRYRAIGNVDRFVEEVIFQNPRARQTMSGATPQFDWLAVSVSGFGRFELRPAANLFAVGDSAAFIDPFTGSGMLMAIESSALLADAIGRGAPDEIAAAYATAYGRRFDRRVRVCRALRSVAFHPRLTSAAISFLGVSRGILKSVAGATRAGSQTTLDRR